MTRAALVFLALPLTACAGDFDALFQQADQYPMLSASTTGETSDATPTTSDAHPTTAGMSAGDTATTTTTATDSGESTDDSGSASASASSTGSDDGGGGDKAVPVEVKVYVTPSPVIDVGEAQVSVWTSRPVASIDLFDNGAPLALGVVPGDPVHVFEVTSDDVPGDGAHTIRAVAHAADGVSGQGEKELLIDVQPGGTDVWPPYVKAGPINGFTSAAMLGNGVAVAGFFETQNGLEAVAMRIDGTNGVPEGAPIMLGKVAFSGKGRGPAIAAAGDGAVFVASTRPANGSTTWALSEVRFGEPVPKGWTQTGPAKTVAHAVTIAGDVVIVVGAVEVQPGTHDLRVWWVSAENGDVVLEQPFAAPVTDDQENKWDEVARGVAIVDGEIVVVGERVIKGDDLEEVRRTVVLRYSLGGDLVGAWTSPGELLAEDGGMAVAPLRGGGFVVTGWGRDLNTIRQVVTRWFTAAGEPGPVRVESTPGKDATGYAVGEDREGKIIISGSIKYPATDVDAWIFAIPGPLGPRTWDVVRDGPGHGPDEAAGLAIDAWGYSYIVGSEFDALQPRAFALRLYP